ncbi:uncharacterized protein IL334_005642 [Kwoniella shivajii]|uniref:Eisosome component PIL1-domain-containing protein n=1 Tax=Kwoniella shivajii TaxID=564305 RepID=A0ABZ1D3P8_9TREE|nr:hypothetical protein IL334_005642 [Kwoniella shivajii]
MTLRNTSGKFSLSNFGRKVSGAIEPNSPTRNNDRYTDDESPARDTFGVAFDGLGKKLKGTLAHQSILPGLGNKDMRALQDIIATEKGVLQVAEKLAIETQKASNSLQPYGIQEGPDLQDILTQSSTLLNHLTTALNIFVEHESNMRSCLKRIREREEGLMEIRSRRRNTGTKADNAERKLSKMGPENKQLPQQTELLERLRMEMRNLDQDIVSEETKIGDFKRQIIKEALSLKFGGLEELGEKMCIIGELGKLLLEEVPLEETPVGYGRAPYTGYERTENAVNEATRCLSTVQFHAANSAPKPPGLPEPPFHQALRAPSLPRERDENNIAAAEEFANYPGNVSSPDQKGKGRDFSLDTADPYGGITNNPYAPASSIGHGQSNIYSEFGGHRTQVPGEVMFNHEDHQTQESVAPQLPPLNRGDSVPEPSVDPQTPDADVSGEHDYEYEQQKAMDAEEAWQKLEREEEAWKEAAEKEEQEAASTNFPTSETVLPNPHEDELSQDQHADADEYENGNESRNGNGHSLTSPWEPLNVKRGNTPEPSNEISAPALPLGTHALGQPLEIQPSVIPPVEHRNEHHNEIVNSSTRLEMPPPMRPSFTPGPSEFYTPTGTIDRDPLASPPIMPAAGGGKISAAAFRRGTKPRGSLEPDELNSPTSETSSKMIRRLPVPPPPGPAGIELPASPAPGRENPYEGFDARQTHSPPPGYQKEDSLR